MSGSTIVSGQVFTDNTGISFDIPILITSHGVVEILIDYFIDNWDRRSTEWMRQVTGSIRLFLEYLEVGENYSDSREVFQNFRHRLLTGSVSLSTGDDKSGLWWSARSANQSQRIINQITNFFEWFNQDEINSKKINISSGGGIYEQRLAAAAYEYRRNKAFLGHTWSSFENTNNKNSGRSKFSFVPKKEINDPPAFPEDKIMDLILKGFKVGNRYNYRDMLITLLLNGAGFRESEPFHLYLYDVCEDPQNKGSALVLIHHPSFGAAPRDSMWKDIYGKPRNGNRVEYLSERFGIQPRDWLFSTSAAGWKGGMHETKYGGFYKQAYWFIPEFGKIFWYVWNIYIEQVMRIETKYRNHPYAFVNIFREPRGEVYKLGKFEASHTAAVQKIGLHPSKQLGTSIHGHRHAYGQRLKKAGISKEMIRRFMHHSDIDSQDIYTQPSQAECFEYLKSAANRLNKNSSNVRNQINQIIQKNDFKLV